MTLITASPSSYNHSHNHIASIETHSIGGFLFPISGLVESENIWIWLLFGRRTVSAISNAIKFIEIGDWARLLSSILSFEKCCINVHDHDHLQVFDWKNICIYNFEIFDIYPRESEKNLIFFPFAWIWQLPGEKKAFFFFLVSTWILNCLNHSLILYEWGEVFDTIFCLFPSGYSPTRCAHIECHKDDAGLNISIFIYPSVIFFFLYSEVTFIKLVVWSIIIFNVDAPS